MTCARRTCALILGPFRAASFTRFLGFQVLSSLSVSRIDAQSYSTASEFGDQSAAVSQPRQPHREAR
eukprot:1377127-Amorphochlora_amoeboformis.AAC.1